MNPDDDAKKVLIQRKHELHEELLGKILNDLQHNLDAYPAYTGPESLFAHVKANTEALLFLIQERKRDRDKRGGDFARPANPLPGSGQEHR